MMEVDICRLRHWEQDLRRVIESLGVNGIRLECDVDALETQANCIVEMIRDNDQRIKEREEAEEEGSSITATEDRCIKTRAMRVACMQFLISHHSPRCIVCVNRDRRVPISGITWKGFCKCGTSACDVEDHCPDFEFDLGDDDEQAAALDYAMEVSELVGCFIKRREDDVLCFAKAPPSPEQHKRDIDGMIIDNDRPKVCQGNVDSTAGHLSMMAGQMMVMGMEKESKMIDDVVDAIRSNYGEPEPEGDDGPLSTEQHKYDIEDVLVNLVALDARLEALGLLNEVDRIDEIVKGIMSDYDIDDLKQG